MRSTVRKYKIQRLIGVGGMAAVYEATHRNGYRVAMKFLLDRHANDATALHLFRREAYIANEVGHPRAIPVLDDDVDEQGCPFLVMPLLHGETLRQRWARAHKRLDLVAVGVFAADALDVLSNAHAHGIVHRDIKPDNLFLTTKGDVCVLDFGIARSFHLDSRVTATGRAFGTLGFMPPEQARGEREAIGPYSDCWAVGATMFALLSGELVHGADNAHAQLLASATKPARSIASVASDLPLPIVRLIDKALAFDPSDRWKTAREMREGLVQALESEGGESFASLARGVRARVVAELSLTNDVSSALETQVPARRKRKAATLVVAVAALVGIGAGSSLLRRGHHAETLQASSARAEPSSPDVLPGSRTVYTESAGQMADGGVDAQRASGEIVARRAEVAPKRRQASTAANGPRLPHGDLFDDDSVPDPRR